MEGDEFNEPMHTNERVRQNLLTSSTYKCVFIRPLIVYQKTRESCNVACTFFQTWIEKRKDKETSFNYRCKQLW